MKKTVTKIAALLLTFQLCVPVGAAAEDTADSEGCIIRAAEDSPVSFHYEYEDGRIFTPVLTVKQEGQNADIPASYDLRDVNGKNYVTSVKNQEYSGQSGTYDTDTCWAHTTLACAESNMLRNGLADKITAENQLEELDLSETHLVWFTNCTAVKDENDPLYQQGYNLGTDGYPTGRSGMTAFSVLSSWTGVQLEKNLPSIYDSADLTDSESLRYTSYAHLQNTNIFDATTEAGRSSAKRHIMDEKHGSALYISFYSATGNTSFYSKENAAYCCNDSEKEASHAVTIIGWDDNYPKENFTSPPEKNGAWICKNSYGTSFGKDGYFYLSYYDVSIDEKLYSFEMESTDNYDHIYQKDFISTHWRWRNDGYVNAVSNYYTAQEEETLEAVAFQTISAAVPYTISVYTNTKENNPVESGTLVTRQKGSVTFAGYHTIQLNEPVALPAGTAFSVVVSLDKIGEEGAFCYSEVPDKAYGSRWAKYDPVHEEFITTGNWFNSYTDTDDSTEYHAFAVKAFTSNGAEIPQTSDDTSIMGDVNGDGKVDAFDASMILLYAAQVGAGQFTGTPEEFFLANRES